MENFKFTKGEWIPDNDNIIIRTSNASPVAVVINQPIDSEERIANAKLIAESPKLLKQLIIMTSLCKIKYGNLDEDVWREIIKSEEAINKATK